MNLIIKLACSPWFWVDILLSVSGGVVVWWGLMIEKRAEKLAIPSDFKPDLFRDVTEKQKIELERGWRILMAGIAIEVIAAFGISIMSGLEIANLNDKSAQSNQLAKQAEFDADQASERASKLDSARAIIEKEAEEIRSTNLVLQARLLDLESKIQPRMITQKQREDFINFLTNSPRGSITIGCRHPDAETINFMQQVHSLLADSGFTIAGQIEYPNNTEQFGNGNSIAILVDRIDDAPSYFVPLVLAFNSIGIQTGVVTNMPTSPTDPLFGTVNTPNKALLFIIEKP